MATPAPTAAPEGASSSVAQPTPGRRVAIVCQAGDATQEAVAGLIVELELEAVVVEAKAGEGAAIDKLEAARGADFAIVLVASELKTPGEMLAVGYLLGAFGSKRIGIVTSGKAALPPQLEGAARHTVDEGGLWRLLLARQMRQAGLQVDLNKAA